MKRSSHNSSRIFSTLMLSIVLLSACRSHEAVVGPTSTKERLAVRVDVRIDSTFVHDSTIVYRDSLIERWKVREYYSYINRVDTLIIKDTIREAVIQYRDKVVYAQTGMQKMLSRLGGGCLLALLVWLSTKFNWKSIINTIINILKK